MAKRNLPNNHAGRNRPRRKDSFFRRTFGKVLRCKGSGAQVSPRGAGIKVFGGGITGMASVLRVASICWFCLTILRNYIKHVPVGSVERCECV